MLLRSVSKDKEHPIHKKDKEHHANKKDRIRNMLIEKFSMKYKINPNDKYLVSLIERFISNDEISTENLNIIDGLLKSAYQDTGFGIKITQPNQQRRTKSLMNIPLPQLDKDDNISVMSGASKISMFSNNKHKSINNFLDKLKDDDNESVTSSSRKAPLSRRSFDSEDEWMAIVKYNLKAHHDSKLKEKMNTAKIKLMQKNNLEIQMKSKLQRKADFDLENQEYDRNTAKHTQLLFELEEERKRKEKEKYMKEKEARDRQLRDNKIRRKKEKKQEKEKDLEHKRMIEEMNEKEEKKELQKKMFEKENFKKIKETNEKNKLLQIERNTAEALEDKKFAEEYHKLLEQLDDDRTTYVLQRQRKANTIDASAVDRVKNKIKEKFYLDDKTLQQYQEDSYKRVLEIEERKRLEDQDVKLKIKCFLDDQVVEKKKKFELEKKINSEQANIWVKDFASYQECEKVHEERIKSQEKVNQDYLVNQIKENADRKKKRKKMSDDEYKLNINIIKSVTAK